MRANESSKVESRAALLRKQPCSHLSRSRFNLTIGESPRFIWFRNAKVGTRTTLELLDNAQVTFAVRNSYQWHYPIEFYKNYFKFAFVRNPWDRLVSGWKNKIVGKNKLNLAPETFQSLQCFENFVDYIAQQDVKTNNVHFRSQVEIIDVDHLDFVGRFERFEQDLQKVMVILGLDVDAIPWKNKTRNRLSYHTYYNERTREIVGRVYQADIQAFSYQFGSPELK